MQELDDGLALGLPAKLTQMWACGWSHVFTFRVAVLGFTPEMGSPLMGQRSEVRGPGPPREAQVKVKNKEELLLPAPPPSLL